MAVPPFRDCATHCVVTVNRPAVELPAAGGRFRICPRASVPRRRYSAGMTEADLVRLLVLGPLFALGLGLVLSRRVRAAGRLLMLVGGLHILGGAWVGRG